MRVTPIRTKLFHEGEALLPFITRHLKRVPERSVVVVTSKIVALAERRTAASGTARAKARLIRAESELAMPTKYVWLTVKDGMLLPSAGIDESNARGRLVLLPKDSFAVARRLRKELQQHYGVKHLGVIITDSRTMPLRAGIVGVALGYAGFQGLKDYRGTPDLFGKKFVFSRVDVADCLATAAVLMMGEGRERQPLATITSAPVQFCERVRRNELRISLDDDMYRPLFAALRASRRKR